MSFGMSEPDIISDCPITKSSISQTVSCGSGDVDEEEGVHEKVVC